MTSRINKSFNDCQKGGGGGGGGDGGGGGGYCCYHQHHVHYHNHHHIHIIEVSRVRGNKMAGTVASTACSSTKQQC